MLSPVSFADYILEQVEQDLEDLSLEPSPTINPNPSFTKIVAYELYADSRYRKLASFLIQRAEQDPNWYTHLCKKTIPKEAHIKVLNILSQLANNSTHSASQVAGRIVKRYMQIGSLTQSTTTLDIRQLLRFSFFLELRLPVIQKTAKNFFEIDPFCIIYDSQSKNSYLPLREKIKKISDNSGSVKTVYATLCIPQNVTTAVSFTACSLNNSFLHAEEVRAYKEDIEIHKQLTGLPGIWPIIYSFDNFESALVPKNTYIFAITPLATGNLRMVKREKLSLKHRLQIGICIAKGVRSTHLSGYLHRDLKRSNVLYEILPQGHAQAGLIDFGLATPLDSASTSFPFACNKYGRMGYSSIELLTSFGQFEGDYTAVELWALGCLLHDLFFDESPPWVSFLDQEIKQAAQPLSLDASVEFDSMAWEYVEDSYLSVTEATQSPEGAIESHIQLVLLDLLRYNPAFRIDAATVVRRLESCLQRYTQPNT